MDKVNIYKIKDYEKDDFIEKLDEKNYFPKDNIITKEITSYYFKNINLNYSMKIYIKNGNSKSPLSWNWILNEFNINTRHYTSKPSAVLLICETRTISQNKNKKKTIKNIYALSFGHAYHVIKPYCDNNWSLNFAQHMNIEKVKSMTLLSPNSLINRKINNYVNFNTIEINSGEALNQINADLKLDENLEEVNNKISLSQSLIFGIDKANLDSLIQLIDYVNFINQTEVKNKIPYYKKINSKEIEDTLNKELIENIFKDIESETEEYCINICEFKHMGDKIKFIHEFDNFYLRYKKISNQIPELNMKQLYNFIKTNLNKNDNPLEIKMEFEEYETGDAFEFYLKEIIIYDCKTESCILDEGTWFEYNDIYLNDMKNSIAEIDIEYEEKYDFHEEEYIKFLREKDSNYDSKTNNEKKSFKRKWYKEKVFNILRERDGFICNDREIDQVDRQKLEIADLFKLDEKSMYAVKIGSTSSNLSYVIDQSLTPMRMLDNGEINITNNEKINTLSKNDIENVYIWLILNRSKLPLKNGKPDLNQFDAIILKNKIDYWKKEVIMSRRNPKIKINYITF